MVSTQSVEHETDLQELLAGILTQFGGAIDFWPLVCLSRRELGAPEPFIDRQWISLREQIQQLRGLLTLGEYEPSEAILEQLVKLSRMSAELREVFDFFINAQTVSQKDLEAAVLKLTHLWQEVRMRIWLLGTLLPIDSPPRLPREKEAYFQGILDGLFDQLLAARVPAADGHLRNGKH